MASYITQMMNAGYSLQQAMDRWAAGTAIPGTNTTLPSVISDYTATAGTKVEPVPPQTEYTKYVTEYRTAYPGSTQQEIDSSWAAGKPIEKTESIQESKKYYDNGGKPYSGSYDQFLKQYSGTQLGQDVAALIARGTPFSDILFESEGEIKQNASGYYDIGGTLLQSADLEALAKTQGIGDVQIGSFSYSPGTKITITDEGVSFTPRSISSDNLSAYELGGQKLSSILEQHAAGKDVTVQLESGPFTIQGKDTFYVEKTDTGFKTVYSPNWEIGGGISLIPLGKATPASAAALEKASQDLAALHLETPASTTEQIFLNIAKGEAASLISAGSFGLVQGSDLLSTRIEGYNPLTGKTTTKEYGSFTIGSEAAGKAIGADILTKNVAEQFLKTTSPFTTDIEKTIPALTPAVEFGKSAIYSSVVEAGRSPAELLISAGTGVALAVLTGGGSYVGESLVARGILSEQGIGYAGLAAKGGLAGLFAAGESYAVTKGYSNFEPSSMGTEFGKTVPHLIAMGIGAKSVGDLSSVSERFGAAAKPEANYPSVIFKTPTETGAALDLFKTYEKGYTFAAKAPEIPDIIARGIGQSVGKIENKAGEIYAKAYSQPLLEQVGISDIQIKEDILSPSGISGEIRTTTYTQPYERYSILGTELPFLRKAVGEPTVKETTAKGIDVSRYAEDFAAKAGTKFGELYGREYEVTNIYRVPGQKVPVYEFGQEYAAWKPQDLITGSKETFGAFSKTSPLSDLMAQARSDAAEYVGGSKGRGAAAEKMYGELLELSRSNAEVKPYYQRTQAAGLIPEGASITDVFKQGYTPEPVGDVIGSLRVNPRASIAEYIRDYESSVYGKREIGEGITTEGLIKTSVKRGVTEAGTSEFGTIRSEEYLKNPEYFWGETGLERTPNLYGANIEEYSTGAAISVIDRMLGNIRTAKGEIVKGEEQQRFEGILNRLSIRENLAQFIEIPGQKGKGWTAEPRTERGRGGITPYTEEWIVGFKPKIFRPTEEISGKGGVGLIVPSEGKGGIAEATIRSTETGIAEAEITRAPGTSYDYAGALSFGRRMQRGFEEESLAGPLSIRGNIETPERKRAGISAELISTKINDMARGEEESKKNVFVESLIKIGVSPALAEETILGVPERTQTAQASALSQILGTSQVEETKQERASALSQILGTSQVEETKQERASITKTWLDTVIVSPPITLPPWYPEIPKPKIPRPGSSEPQQGAGTGPGLRGAFAFREILPVKSVRQAIGDITGKNAFRKTVTFKKARKR